MRPESIRQTASGATLQHSPRAGQARRRRFRAVGALLALILLAVTACSGDDTDTDTVRVARTVGEGEGTLALVTVPGYVENGSNDPRVDWVTPFEERTKCRVSIKTVTTAQEMTSLMSSPSRRYDGVSAPPEVAGQLIGARQVAPVNPDLVEGFKDLDPRLRGLVKQQDGGDVTGVPYVWGTNLLMYDAKAVQPPPGSWAAIFDPAQAARYPGRLTMRDSPLTIAEAALYLKAKNRSLGIDDPYALTRRQLQAATAVLAAQRPYVRSYWEEPADAVNLFAGGEAVLGEVWPYQLDVLSRAGKPVAGAPTEEGVTGWLNSWMIGARAEHPNCMYQWLKWTASPDVQQQVAEWSGVAPANPGACSGDRLKSAFCSAHRVGDRAFLTKVHFARTPAKDCGDDGGNHCTDYAEWVRAWQSVRK